MTDSNARHEPDEHKVGATRPDETDYQVFVYYVYWLCTSVNVGSSRIDSYVPESWMSKAVKAATLRGA